jgi:exopolyphosphatase / guanosine-5'-triphosphate,3'-diphosphate pyrophosphatase
MDRTTPEVLAAVDCGTNSTRLLIAVPGGPDVRLMRITRLGQGVDATAMLAAGAIGRTLEVLGEFREVMDSNRVSRVRMVATSAVRDARNGDDFLKAASDTIGSPAELLDGGEEGRLAFAGASAHLDRPSEHVVVIDIGGGSTELVTGVDGVRGISLDLGCVRLTERYLRHDPPLAGEIDGAVKSIDAQLGRAAAALPGLVDPKATLVGLAGTVSTLAALDQGLDHYDRDRLHHYVLSRRAVEHWCEVLSGEPAAARARRRGMAEGRHDVIVGGVLVLRQMMARFRFAECIVSEADILDGLVASLAGGGS